MRRSVIVDPAIKSPSGHHLGIATVLSKSARDLGHQPVWLAHKKLDTKLVPDFVNFVPAFSSTIYEHQIGLVGRALKPLIGDHKILRKGLRERPWEVGLRRKIPASVFLGDRHSELARALQSQKLTRTDCIIVPTADTQTVDMLAAWCIKQRKSDQPLIHIRTCWSDLNMPFAHYGGGFPRAISQISSIARHVTFSSETDEGARLLTVTTGEQFQVCPHIVDVTQFRPAQPRQADMPILVGWLGEPRAEKGTKILPEIVRCVLSGIKKSQVKFLIQGSGRTSRRSREFDAALAEFGDAVERLPIDISPQSYLEALDRSNILLFPYEPKDYPISRGSGVAVEALLSGKPMVATTETFPSTLISSENGALGFNAESLAEGVIRIASNYESFRSGALRARGKALAKYDPLATYRQMTAI